MVEIESTPNSHSRFEAPRTGYRSEEEFDNRTASPEQLERELRREGLLVGSVLIRPTALLVGEQGSDAAYARGFTSGLLEAYNLPISDQEKQIIMQEIIDISKKIHIDQKPIRQCLTELGVLVISN